MYNVHTDSDQCLEESSLEVYQRLRKTVMVYSHPSRKSMTGTIFGPRMRFKTEEEILKGFRVEGFSHARLDRGIALLMEFVHRLSSPLTA